MISLARVLRAAPVLAALVLAGAPSPGRAGEVVALMPASGANVDRGTLAAAHEVLRGYLERTGAFTVRTTRLGAVTDDEVMPADAAALAAEVGAPLAASLRLATLGSVQHARLTVYQAPSGREVWTDSMPAGAPGDLDPVLQRLATAWARRSSATSTAEIDTLTQKEAAPLPKIQATRQRGFRLGMLRAVGTRRHSEPTATGGGFTWLYDARWMLVDVSFDYFGGRHVQDLGGGFGALFPLTRTDFSPYLGAGLHLATSWIDDGWSAGFQPYASAGAILGRLSTVGFRAEVTWRWNAYATGGVHASELVGTLGVQF